MAAEHQPPPLDLANVVPIVRDASYFMDRGGARVALVGKLTDFIGIGLVIDEPSSMRVIAEDELPQPRTDVEDLQFLSRAFENFGALAHDILLQDMGYDSDVIAELPYLVRPHPQSYPPRFIIGRPGPEDRARLAAIQL